MGPFEMAARETAVVLGVTTFLLNALWQVPVAVAIGLLGDRFLRRASGRSRHLLWLAVLAACLLLPAASLLPARTAPVAANRDLGPSSAAMVSRSGRVGTPGLPSQAEAIARPPRLLALPPLKGFLAGLATECAFAYALALLGFGIRLARAWGRALGLSRRAHPVEIPADSFAVVARCRDAFATAGGVDVEILESVEIPSPVTLGARRPLILLPPGFFATASADEVTTALGHEMAHVRRRDYAVNLLCEILLLPLAFHPAVRWVRRRLAETRELACDEAVLETLLRPRAYARSLLSLAAAAAGLPRPSITLGVADAPFLEVRMKSILNPPAPLSPKRTRASLGAAILLLVALGTAAASFPVRASAEESPGTAAADAAALNPCEGPGPRFLLAPEQTAWTNMVPPNQNGQTFTATRPHITGVEVDLITGNPRPGDRDTLTLTLATLGGDVLAQVHRTLASGRDGWVCFAMPPGGIDVTPGETLALHLEDTGKVIFGWRYGVDGYPRGHALWLNRPERRFDRAFRVHDAISAAAEPQ
jgi:beta-lactamase regulating signal transducer with metallopeptidase domain